MRGDLVFHVATRVAALLAAIRAREDGQGLAEYTMLLAFVAIMAIAGLTMLGSDIMSSLSGIGEKVLSVSPR